MMSKAPVSYEVQAVARAIDIPERRLEGWVERGVVAPTTRASGTGTRIRFSPQDVLRVAIITEIQRLFGTELRPGRIAATLGANPWHLPFLDTALRRHIKAGESGKSRTELFLCVHHDGTELRITYTANPQEKLKATAAVLVINPAVIWRTIQPRLEK